MSDLNELNRRVSAAKTEVEARGETFYPGASRVHLAAFPPKERWNDWVELDASEFKNQVNDGLRVARKQVAPDLLIIPVAAPSEEQ